MRNIDWKFIEREEKPGVPYGYVPKGANGWADANSGVTVATGVDIGQRNREEIIRLPITDDLKRKLLFYVGLKGEPALQVLQARPLMLTDQEVKDLDRAIYNQIINQVEKRFNESSPISFERSPGALQTVIASLAWHYGPGFAIKNPDLWCSIVNHAYEKLAEMLEQMGKDRPQFQARRDREAALIRKLLESNNELC